MFKTVNSMGISPFNKTYSLSFEGKGKIRLETKELERDSFTCNLPPELKNDDVSDDLIKQRNNIVRSTISDLIQKFIDAGRIYRENNKLLLVKKATIEDGDGEIPDDIYYPDAEIVVTGGEVNTIRGKDVSLQKTAKVKDVKAINLNMNDESKITGKAEASEKMEMHGKSKANVVKAKYLDIRDESKITGNAEASENMYMKNSAKAKSAKAINLKMNDESEITGNAEASNIGMNDKAIIKGNAKAGGIIMRNRAKANNVSARTLYMRECSEITGNAKADLIDMENGANIAGTAVSREMAMKYAATANNVETVTLSMNDSANITGTVKAKTINDNRHPGFKETHPLKLAR